MKIFWKIFALSFLLFMVVVLFIFYFTLSRQILEVEKHVVQENRVIGSLLSKEIEEDFLERKWPFVSLDKIAQRDDFLFWWVVKKDGTIYLADNAAYMKTQASHYFPQLSEMKVDKNTYLNHQQNYGIIILPIKAGKSEWTFWLGFSLKKAMAIKNRLVFIDTTIFLLALLIFGVMLFLSTIYFTRPIKALIASAAIIGKGDLGHRAGVRAADELGELAQAFNDMVAALQKSDARLRTILTAADNVSFIITGLSDTDYRILELSPGAERIFGYRREEVLGKPVAVLHFPQNMPSLPETLQPGLQEKPGFTQESILVRQSGESFPALFSMYPIADTDGKIIAILWMAIDITQPQQIKEALRESEEKYRLVFDKAPLGIMHYDPSSTITDCNEKFAEIIGAPKERFLGFNMLKQLNDDRMRDAVIASLQGEVGHYEGEYLSVTAAKLTPVRAIYQPIFSADGILSGGVAIFEDISERKKAEAERLRYSKLESLGTLAGGIAHDFNNLLTAILGNISLAELDSQNERDTKKSLIDAERACHKAQMLAQQLLTFARGGAPIKELVLVEDLVSEAATFVCRGSKVQCSFGFPDHLWGVEADPGQITQVIQNLIINAIQAMPMGGIIRVQAENLTVESSAGLPLEAGRYVKISIQDHGVGIPDDHLTNIFDPYFTTKQTGSGLGLATAYSIVRNHHGHIAVMSSLGVGTTFYVYLPAVDRQVAKPPDKEREILTGQGRILLMDDEAMVRKLLDSMLTHLGYEVELAKDGAEALHLFLQAREAGRAFDAVILDLTVPGGMGGKEAIQELLKIDSRIKAIVSSGYSHDSIMSEFDQYGFSGVIAKPYSISALSKVLNEVLHEGKG
jgi:PAS domain S-box-containing protein